MAKLSIFIDHINKYSSRNKIVKEHILEFVENMKRVSFVLYF